MKAETNALLIEASNDQDGVKELLEAVGLTHLEHCCAGDKAIQLLQNNQYDVVFLKGNLLTTTDLNVIKTIMTLDAQCYLVILMDVIRPELVREATKAGVGGFLTSPFTSEKITQELEKYLLLKQDQRVCFKS